MNYPDINIFKNIIVSPHDLYHVTNNKIEILNESFLGKKTFNHNNSALGFWCSTVPMYYKNFGVRCYKVILKNQEINKKCWIYEDFREYCFSAVFSREDYINLRNYLIEEGIDLLYIYDRNGFVNEVIIINYDCVSSLESTDFPDNKLIPLKVI